MGSVKSGNGKYPEEVIPFNSKVVMIDDKFLLMKQCIRDARELHIMTRHFDNSCIDIGPYISKWKYYERDVTRLAEKLFEARINNPLELKDLQRIVFAGESASQEVDELKRCYEELKRVMENIQQKREESNQIKKELTQLRAKSFLISTIGEQSFSILKNRGYLTILGTNNATYKITNKGEITKYIHKDKLIRGSEIKVEWQGKITNKHGLPLMDAIATVYAQIINDSDHFDENKGCGNIYIKI